MSFNADYTQCAGKKAGDEGLREGVMKLRDEGHNVEVRRMDATLLHGMHQANGLFAVVRRSTPQVRVTWEADDVERFTKEALEAGVDTIVAAGGVYPDRPSSAHTACRPAGA
jgi:diacylglycerol kinase family enzyme